MNTDPSSGQGPSSGRLAPGTRVVVLRDTEWDGPWQREFEGTIDEFWDAEPVLPSPFALRDELLYWVDFDEPQYDCDGCGPYRKAQIRGRYLRALPQP